jgi:hypothetical protein
MNFNLKSKRSAYPHVRHQRREIHNKTGQIKTLTNRQAAAFARRINRRELNPG